MRRITTLLTAVCLTLPLVAIMGCGILQHAIYKSAIEKALRDDALTGSEPTVGHTAAMRTIDTSNCPQEFRDAYIRHIHAWDQMAKIHKAELELNSQDDAAAAAGLIATIFNSDETPFSDHIRAEEKLKQMDADASNDIRTTFQEVTDIANKYDARVPHE
jgi:hypothetical protein